MKITQTTKPLYPETLWDRPLHYYHKGGGKILVLAGSQKSSAALSFCVEALYKAGSANIMAGFPEPLLPVYSGLLPPEILLPLSSTYGGSLSEKALPLITERLEGTKTCLIGPGLSANSETQALVIKTLNQFNGIKIVVSDAILALTGALKILAEKGGREAVKTYLSKQPGTNIYVFTKPEYERVCKAIQMDASYTSENLEQIAKLLGGYTVFFSEDITLLEPGGDTVITKNIGATMDERNPLFAFSAIVASALSHGNDKIFEKIATSSFILKEIFNTKKKRDDEGMNFLKYIQPVIRKLEEEHD